MMKFIFMLLFMIPLSYMGGFWLNQYLYYLLFFFFFLNFSFNYLFVNISYFLGYDLLSFVMILLSFWICALMMMASEKIYMYKYYSNLFLLVMLMMIFSLFLTFGSLNLFVFYLFFEMSLIPTLFLIVGWGYQPERLQAGVYMLFYTLFASLPMMIFIFYYYKLYNSLDYFYFYNCLDVFYLYICMCAVFLVKMPMYFVHLWLPKAHVEAPVSGSMILAGVMLKLGGYGLMRLLNIFLVVGLNFNFFFVSICMIGGFLVSLICLRQVDVKSLIAYSSVSHMSLVLGGLMTFNYWGMCGSLVMMLAHGLCSSGLFCLANINYERLMSRSIYLNKGMINIMPSLSLWWFLLCSSNMAAPPSLNLLGEIMLMNSLVNWHWICMLLLSLISFFSASYTLYLYSFTQHGKLLISSYSYSCSYVREYLLLFLHWVPLNFLILKSEYFSLWI